MKHTHLRPRVDQEATPIALSEQSSQPPPTDIELLNAARIRMDGWITGPTW